MHVSRHVCKNLYMYACKYVCMVHKVFTCIGMFVSAFVVFSYADASIKYMEYNVRMYIYMWRTCGMFVRTRIYLIYGI